jgi:hypothetical protein
MSHEAIMVFTGRSPNRILKEGGSQAWVLNPRRARECEYLVCTQNQHAGKWADPTEPHGGAFLVGKISGLSLSKEPKESPEDPDRYLIQISEFTRVNIPKAWDGSRNPVRYVTLEAKGIDPSALAFELMPESAPREPQGENHAKEADHSVPPLSIADAKHGLAAFFGVSPDAVEITIHG